MLDHLAIIMDGNGRWAALNQKSRIIGHRAGAKNIKPIVENCLSRGIKVLSLFAFSTENWARPHSEVQSLLELFQEMVSSRKTYDFLVKNNIRFKWTGLDKKLPLSLLNSIKKLEDITSSHSGMILNILFNYGSQQEIAYAGQKTRQMSDDYLRDFKNNLLTKGLPNVDMIIRTGGEHRLSNCLLFQCAYAEIYFSDIFWPEFTQGHLDKALGWFAERVRRFGGL